MFLDRVITYLNEKSSIGLVKEEIKELLRYSVANFPQWLTIVPNQNGEILRMNLKVNQEELFKQVDGL